MTCMLTSSNLLGEGPLPVTPLRWSRGVFAPSADLRNIDSNTRHTAHQHVAAIASSRVSQAPNTGSRLRGFLLVAHPNRTQMLETRLAGGCGGSGCAPPMPAVAQLVAGTEPERSGGGVRHMLNLVSCYTLTSSHGSMDSSWVRCSGGSGSDNGLRYGSRMRISIRSCRSRRALPMSAPTEACVAAATKHHDRAARKTRACGLRAISNKSKTRSAGRQREMRPCLGGTCNLPPTRAVRNSP